MDRPIKSKKRCIDSKSILVDRVQLSKILDANRGAVSTIPVDRNQFSTGDVAHDRENLYNSRAEGWIPGETIGFPSRFAYLYDRRKLPSFLQFSSIFMAAYFDQEDRNFLLLSLVSRWICRGSLVRETTYLMEDSETMFNDDGFEHRYHSCPLSLSDFDSSISSVSRIRILSVAVGWRGIDFHFNWTWN